ncbi:hypothetical protein V496_00688 [Pseudogymnoascus sp. VKM F-4515 (FW-2607)]|nr:hypothetical protein V496_00688 [Pseudogymnoascus sp. VKM F-4515 (FW-2607)]
MMFSAGTGDGAGVRRDGGASQGSNHGEVPAQNRADTGQERPDLLSTQEEVASRPGGWFSPRLDNLDHPLFIMLLGFANRRIR